MSLLRPVTPASAGVAGPAVVIEFSDYECPFCAIAHAETDALLASRPDVRLVHKNFPLDSACNWMVTEAIHPGACAVSEAVLCAAGLGSGGRGRAITPVSGNPGQPCRRTRSAHLISPCTSAVRSLAGAP